MKYSREDSPCIGICSTVYGDDVCRGCKRFSQEIIAWNTFQQGERDNVYDRIDALIEKVMTDKVEVFDTDLLLDRLNKHSIRYRTDDKPLGWAFILLRDGADKIKNIENFGVRVKAPYQGVLLLELIKQIDDEYYALANDCFAAQSVA